MKAPRLPCLLAGICMIGGCRDPDGPPRPTEAADEPAPKTNVPAPLPPSTATPVEAPSTYPIRWADDLKLATLEDVEASLAREDPIGFGELALGDQRALPTSCKQWAQLRQAGYRPSTSLEVQADGGALFQCEVLRLLGRARPAQVSFVRELPKGGPELLGIVPVAFATTESNERAQRLSRFAKEGASLAAFDPKAKVVKAPVHDMTRIAEGDGQSLVDLQPKAWADFDGDGVEDVVMAVRNSMTEGSHSMARVMVVTRSNPTDVLRVIAVPGE